LSKIIREVDHGIRVVAGVQVRVSELVCSDAGTSFEVHRVDTGTDLTEAQCFDDMPTDDQIAALLAPPAGWLACPGCGAVFSESTTLKSVVFVGLQICDVAVERRMNLY